MLAENRANGMSLEQASRTDGIFMATNPHGCLSLFLISFQPLRDVGYPADVFSSQRSSICPAPESASPVRWGALAYLNVW